MGFNFDAKFNELNTNKTGKSAQILDKNEIKNAKEDSTNSIWILKKGMNAEDFKAANQHCSNFDANKDGIVSIQEQMSTISTDLKNVWSELTARFFKDDIIYDDSDANKAAEVTQQVETRIKNCKEYIEYAKKYQIDIYEDNSGTGIDNKNGLTTDSDVDFSNEIPGLTYTDIGKEKVSEEKTKDGRKITYADGSTATYNNNGLKISATGSSDNPYECQYTYNEDGSYSVEVNNNDSISTWNYDKNNRLIHAYGKDGDEDFEIKPEYDSSNGSYTINPMDEEISAIRFNSNNQVDRVYIGDDQEIRYRYNNDGSIDTTYLQVQQNSDGSVSYIDENDKIVEQVGNNYSSQYSYNDDGSYKKTTKYSNGNVVHTAWDNNNNKLGSYIENSNGE